ncbi:MAG TPA: glycosyltransferase [Planctomycetota bacterium]|nr:glycosyltransferase [Planctomycetota bacterium]
MPEESPVSGPLAVPAVGKPLVLHVLRGSRIHPETGPPPALKSMERTRARTLDGALSDRDRFSALSWLLPIAPGVVVSVLGMRLARRLGGERPALIHCHSGIAAAALLQAGAARAPIVVSVGGGDLGRGVVGGWWVSVLKEIWREASAVIVEGARAASDVVSLACLPRKVHVVKPAVDLEAIARCGPRSDASRAEDPRLSILFAGPLVERQGLSFALEAVARLARRPPGVRLRILGRGPLESASRALASHLGISSSVEFLGAPGPGRLVEELARVDTLVAPSRTAPDGDREAGAPPAVLTALAAAVPVVASRHADIPDAVIDSRTGFLVEEGSAEALVVGLRRILNDPAFAREMGLAGRALVEAEHDARKAAARLEEIYSFVLGERAP